MSKKELTVWGGSTFDLTPATKIKVSTELQAALSEEDEQGYSPPNGISLPIVEIDQSSGDFSMFMFGRGDKQPGPVNAGDGLSLTFIADSPAQVYFGPYTGKNQPVRCRSVDGINGQGEPGGNCRQCVLYGPAARKTKDYCKSQINIVAYDWNANDYYLLRLGPSGLGPYGSFKRDVRNGDLPLRASVVRVTTEKRDDKGKYYVPVFKQIGEVPVELFKKFGAMAKEIMSDGGVGAQAHDDGEDEALPY